MWELLRPNPFAFDLQEQQQVCFSPIRPTKIDIIPLAAMHEIMHAA
jgi:hypothetical protein